MIAVMSSPASVHQPDFTAQAQERRPCWRPHDRGAKQPDSAAGRHRLERDNAATGPWKLLEVLPGQIQMLHQQLRRKVAEPFGERDLFVFGSAEHLQELQNIATGV